MSAKILKTAKRKVMLDARPDRPDLRDRIYQPPLRSLPPQYPSAEFIRKHLAAYTKAGLILDQGQEGACTGFGLAGMINYLLYRQSVATGASPPPRVSTRMLYHLARKYDEWPGEDYEGSSCRGAMKGWFHHGVCSDALWPYRDKSGKAVFVSPKDGWDLDAPYRPVGAYYRITVDAIADIQAAINEVGAVSVSSDVHAGWDKIATSAKSLPGIPWISGAKSVGGHAYVLVGYDPDGFIIQNSWGPDWGYHGFAKLNYGDWLENADDAWVAVMGAPIATRSPAILLSSSKTKKTSKAAFASGLVNGASAAAVTAAPAPGVWSTKEAVEHAVILGNDGLPDHVTIEDADASASIDRVCFELPKAWLKTPKKGGRRIALYVHGGLNDLSDGIARAQVIGPWFDKNGVYPVFVVWQSGFVDSIKNIIGDLVGDLISQARGRKAFSVLEFASDARDRLIEQLAIPGARPVWSQMKQNAVAASTGDGGMAQIAKSLVRLKNDFNDLEINLVGHSAGAIVLGAFFDQLRGNNLAARTVSLYAPACTAEFANSRYVPAAANKVIDPKRTFFEILSDKKERDDSVGPYGKSLLYLVSRALEPQHKTPILGMDAVWTPALDKEGVFASDDTGKPNVEVAAWRKDWLKIGNGPQTLSVDKVLEELPRSDTDAAHGVFDNWIECVERTLQRIIGLGSVNQLSTRITSLKGF